MALKQLSTTMTLSTIVSILLLQFSLASATNPLCAAVCVCEESIEEKFVKLDCSKVYLSIVPPLDDWPINITHMDLSSNNISALDFELSHNSVEVLDLSHNRISTVVQNAFGGLNKLKYLNLATNAIRSFDENGFYGLEHLKSLNLSSNGLYFLPDGLFYNFIGLQELSLADNPLVHIDSIHFNRMINLRWLDLSNTDLYTLPANIFHTTGQLEFLDLSANEFHEVPIDALRSARSLQHLRFSENSIEVLDKKSFRKLLTLQVLELNSMDHLKEVKEEAFSDLANLQSLEMKFNRHLTTIDRKAFDGLFNESRPTLQEIDLEANQLRTLDKDMIACARVRKFNVQRNPWVCDCSMKWIKKCEIQKIYAADLKCYEPPALHNHLIVNLSDKQLECNYKDTPVAKSMVHHEHVVRTISVGLAAGLLVILAFGIALIFKWKDIRSWYRSNRKGSGAVYYVRARANPREI
ncbi:hypothetical protein TNIN_110211 [Trichonephila inaurata madagascariensis]|uniref:LRRCT domain-containing protein n=1 Tax=Trichonephila inaurata madagascariensis TaxID=2747483 RepID=A0A8X6YUS8_9ARAC|nr:hypothetical protein TNIN_110211 [Trichonephila inaurata madagascariensis]